MDDDATFADFSIGDRVEVHPCTDFWMQGDRFGVVTGIYQGKGFIRIKMDRSRRSLRLHPKNILKPRA